MTHTYEHEEHGDECDPCKCGWSTRTWNRNMLWLWSEVPWRPAAAASVLCMVSAAGDVHAHTRTVTC